MFWSAAGFCRRCTRRGVCLLCRLPAPPLACFPAPLPRRGRISPRPPSPAGKGETKVISCKGLRPLHPRAEPKRRWEQGRTTHPAGACPAGWRLTLPPLYPAGGVPALSPPCPAFSLLSCPLFPQPALAERSSRRHLLSLPRGRGPSQTPKFLSPGPPSPWLPALPIERRFYRFCAELAIPKAHPPGAGLAGRTSAARVQSRGCKGRSPLHKITLKSPPSRREGGRGDGGRKSS